MEHKMVPNDFNLQPAAVLEIFKSLTSTLNNKANVSALWTQFTFSLSGTTPTITTK